MNFFQNILSNFKTTFGGGIPAVGMIIQGISEKNWVTVAGGVGLLMVSLFASDYSVTKKDDQTPVTPGT